jgi:hypothetical protein
MENDPVSVGNKYGNAKLTALTTYLYSFYIHYNCDKFKLGDLLNITY